MGSSSRTSYGIVAYVNVADVGTATVVTVIHDITSDRDALEALVFACNHLELSTIHLIDVVEDFLAN